MSQPADTYTCAMCGETNIKGWTDEEAEAEKDDIFGPVPLEDCDVICDDCFQLVNPLTMPDQG